MVISVLGTAPPMLNLPFPLTGVWPVAGFWAAIAWSRLNLSVWAALCLVMIGFVQDYLLDAPLGAWPLAFISAYVAGLVVNGELRKISDALPSEFVAVVLGLISGLFGLVIAGDTAGGAEVIDSRLIASLWLTGGLYFICRGVFAPMDRGEVL